MFELFVVQLVPVVIQRRDLRRVDDGGLLNDGVELLLDAWLVEVLAADNLLRVTVADE